MQIHCLTMYVALDCNISILCMDNYSLTDKVRNMSYFDIIYDDLQLRAKRLASYRWKSGAATKSLLFNLNIHKLDITPFSEESIQEKVLEDIPWWWVFFCHIFDGQIKAIQFSRHNVSKVLFPKQHYCQTRIQYLSTLCLRHDVAYKQLSLYWA